MEFYSCKIKYSDKCQILATAICHKTSLAVADRLFGPVTSGLRQRYVSRFTKLHVRQAAVRLERCCTSDLDTEVRERNATSSRPALVANTTACRVQTVGSRLPLSA